MNLRVWVTILFEIHAVDILLYRRVSLADEATQVRLKNGKHNIWQNNETGKKYPRL